MRPSKATAVLILAMTLFALRAPLTKFLADYGQKIGVGGERVISFCNILFIGNLCAAAVVLGHFRASRVLAELRSLARRGASLLAVSSVLELAPPILAFAALAHTSVTNVILLSRFGPLLFAVFGAMALGQAVTRVQWVGYAFSLAAIGLAVLYSGMWSVNRGDALMLLAGVANCANTVVNRVTLRHAGLAAFLFARNAVGAAVFFVVAVIYYGWGHFGDALRPQLWGAMAVYATLAVAGAELAWYFALQRLDAGSVGSYSFVAPAAGIAFGLLLLGERPAPAQWAALALVTVGILIANSRAIRATWREWAARPSLVVSS